MFSKNKKIIYIANIRLPTEKAHGIQIINTCSAMLGHGARVELVVPKKKNEIKETIHDYYNLDKAFDITYVKHRDFSGLGRVGYRINSLLFNLLALKKYLEQDVVIYSREILPLILFGFLGKKTFFESHVGGWKYVYKFFFKKIAGVVCITQGLSDYYLERGINSAKIVVAPDAVDSKLFDGNVDVNQSRIKYAIPSGKKIVMYAGSFFLYSWKGIDTFIEASWLKKEYCFVAIGGEQQEIDLLIANGVPSNLILIKKVRTTDIPNLLKLADILVIPNKKGDIVSERFTSPMKLFEYMASGVPIVASDLPSMREILNENNALFFEANDSVSLAGQIDKAIKDHNFSKNISVQALIDVKQYSWENRAKKILNLIQKYE